MTRYTRISPFMDPNVFRSSSHSNHNKGDDSLSHRQATLDLSRSLYRDDCFRDPLDRQVDSCLTHDYGSDRRHHDQFTSSSRDISNLVRRYARQKGESIISYDADCIRTNHNAILTSNAVEQVTNTTLIQPKVRLDGRYPLEFAMLMTIAHFMALPEGQLDRLLDEYEIPTRGFAGHNTLECDCDSTMGRGSRLSKLSELLDLLGAQRIADVLRSGAGGGGGMSGSRELMMISRR